MNKDIQWGKQRLVLHMHLGCGSLSITIPMSLLANEFDIQSELHGQVSLTAVNQICVFHEVMSYCKYLDSLAKRLALKM